MKVPEHSSMPPKYPLQLLRWFCHPQMLEDVEGDLSELFAQRCEKSVLKARIQFLLDVILLFRPGMIKNFSFNKGQITTAMLKNYLKIAFRNSQRYRGYTMLNLLGLIVGIASSILILLWVNDEVKVDRFHARGDHMYQLFRNMRQSNGVVSTTQSIPKPAGDLVATTYPEVEHVVRISWPMDLYIGRGKDVAEENGRFASKTFFEYFSFNLLRGDAKTALEELNAVVISQQLAAKHFGETMDDALGQTLRINDQYDVVVTGIFEDTGDDSSLQFDFILNAQAFFNLNDWVDDWGNGSFFTYLVIPNSADVSVVGERVYNEIKDHTADNDKAGDETLILHKFQDTYLYSNFDNGVVSGGRIDYVNIMTVVAFFILLVAGINFMNLATARSNRRSKEIGLRKVMGAERKAVSFQFYFEAFMATIIAVFVAVIVVLILLPFFNMLVDKNLVIDFGSLTTWLFILGLILVLGVFSGSYPAFLLSNFSIIQSLRGTIQQSTLATNFRRGLVMFQFAISTLLIIGTAVIYKQLGYIMNKDLGVDKDNLVAVRLQGDLPERLETYKTELLRIPEVQAVTTASGNPIDYGRSTSSAQWEGKDPSAGYEVNVILSDEDFIETMGMEIKSGRAFSKQIEDSTNYIINEVAADLMGFEDPLGKSLSFWGIKGKIIGVVKDFHMSNMYEPIAPLIITCINPSTSTVALVRIAGNPNDALQAIEEVTQQLSPAFNFEYEFIDELYADGYRNERTINLLAAIFAIISILISCLGLLALASYSAEQRSREIGVRKVHGASVSQILVLLTKDYSKLMAVAFIVAVPVGYYVTQDWLNGFEFRTVLDPLIFITAGLITFVIAVFTVAMKSYQAATVNPVNSLKDE